MQEIYNWSRLRINGFTSIGVLHNLNDFGGGFLREISQSIDASQNRANCAMAWRIVLVTLSVFAVLMPRFAHADVYVVVANTNPLRSVTAKELQAFYMGRNRAFTTGEFASVYDLPRNNPVRNEFYHVLTGMSPAQINSYWSRLMFTGQTLPPQSLSNEQAMLEQIKRSPSAIGYLSKEPSDTAVRTILVIKTGAAI